ncbi:MAG: TonB-dependent receptor [Caulobacter sp.]
MPGRVLLFATVSFAVLSTQAMAADAPPIADDLTQVDELVVTGTRTAGRSRLDTLAPVDVVTSETIAERGTTELAAALAAAAPSINFPRPSLTDGTDAIRPATLRGQGPDQTLVLVNGARRHPTALVNLNGSVGRGSAAVDLNAIPSVAIDRIEVLRDGASAQYGSDAIAGVINLRLREARSGGGITITSGQFITELDTPRAGRSRQMSDGRTTTVAGWQGLPLGADGFLTVSGEYRDRANTNRSDFDPRVTPSRVTARFGDPDVTDLTLYANAGAPLSGGWESYGWASYQKREAASAAFFRLATSATQNVPAIYPNGFLPLITTDTEDYSVAGGARGDLNGFNVDVNLVYGRNQIDYGVEHSLNASLGATSPTSFDAGSLIYDQLVLSLDAAREYDVGFAGPLNVAFGLEARRESYEIRAGEPASYIRGPFTAAATGAQSFPGLQPSNEVDESRDAIGVYVDLEGELIENLTASAAVRYENYSDFGSNTSGKLAARYDFTPAFAIRGAVSSGFRAPSLQQQYFTSTATVFIGGVPFETGTFPSISPVGVILGGKPLEAETSTNYSAGLVFHAAGFELTVDGYQINVDNRIVLSENLTGSATAAVGTTSRIIYDLLSPYGSSAARFFINGVNTETKGIDVVARYRITSDTFGRFDLTAAANFNDLTVTRVPTTAAVSSLPVPPALFSRQNIKRFEEGAPETKWVLQNDWSLGDLGATLRGVYYSDVLSPGTATATDASVGAHWIIDLEARYQIPGGPKLAVGADNLFDEYPDALPITLNTSGATPFSSFSPFGFNGRFVYARLSYNW